MILPNINYLDAKPLSQVSNAGSIQLEPLTTEDWELIDINSDFLEGGGLLQQVSIVYPNQILTFKLGTDYVRVKVVSNGFISSLQFSSSENEVSDSEDSSHMSLDESEESTQSHITEAHESLVTNQSNLFLRLVANTQVIVNPKPRARKRDPRNFPISTALRIQPSKDDFSHSMKDLFQDFDMASPPEQLTAFVNPLTLSSDVPGWDDTVKKLISSMSGDNYLASLGPTYAFAFLTTNANVDNDVQKCDQILITVLPSDEVSKGHIGENLKTSFSFLSYLSFVLYDFYTMLLLKAYKSEDMHY